MYFTLPGLTQASANPAVRDTIRKEWADLKALAGTNQAIGFGRWGYIAGFASLDPEKLPTAPSFLYHNVPSGGAASDLRVRPASEPPAKPAMYQTNAGIVKLSDQGNQAELVKQLREALKK